jgi:hypothetical protein
MKPNEAIVAAITQDMIRLLKERHALNQEDLEYTVQAVAKLKDERLKSCVATLIGWGDDERAEIETFVAVALEVFKKTNPSKLRDAAKTVEIKYLLRKTNER